MEQFDGCARPQWWRALLAPDYARINTMLGLNDPRPLILLSAAPRQRLILVVEEPVAFPAGAATYRRAREGV